MTPLGDRERDAIREVLAGLEHDVEVLLELGPAETPITLLAAGGREVDPVGITRDIVTSVSELSERVRLRIVEQEARGPWPRTTIGQGLVYKGMPAGYELTSLVHAIAEAGRAAPSLSPESLARLETLERDVAIDVYVTPT